MKGVAPTSEQKKFWDRLSGIGCIACLVEFGPHDPGPVSIHHINGRSKTAAHWDVIPLCAGHHQKGTGPKGFKAIHGDKVDFVRQYGSEEHLHEVCLSIIGDLRDFK